MPTTIFSDLNRDYYAEPPSTYLRTRITLLLALGDPAQPIHRSLEGGLSAWGMSAQADPPHSAEDIDGYAVVESISVMYLAAEALVRVFLAHVNQPQCPPLVLASLTSFREFKRQAKGILDDPPDLDVLRQLFRGTPTAPEGVTDEAWADDGQVLSYLLGRAADLLLNHSHVYNSTKHGLAVHPRKSAVKLGRDDDPLGPAIDHTGSAIRYLQRGPRGADSTETWSEVIQFEFPSINLALASAFTDELEALHDIAAARFRGESVRIFIRPLSLLENLQKVPFAGGRTGLLALAMNRNFTVRVRNR